VVAYLRTINGIIVIVFQIWKKNIALIVAEKHGMNIGWTTHKEKWNYKLEP